MWGVRYVQGIEWEEETEGEEEKGENDGEEEEGCHGRLRSAHKHSATKSTLSISIGAHDGVIAAQYDSFIAALKHSFIAAQ